jgi:hypothetical protein
MNHNDKVKRLLEETLEMYDMEAIPPPCLTIFYNVDLLISWYADILLKEMSTNMDLVFSVIRRNDNLILGLHILFIWLLLFYYL